MKEPLLVKYDPRNLSRIYVQNPCGWHWPVPAARGSLVIAHGLGEHGLAYRRVTELFSHP